MADSPELGVLAGWDRKHSTEVDASPLEAEVVALFDQLHHRLMGYLIGFNPLTIQDCEEIVQEAFLALFQHLRRGRPKQNLTGWLFRVVHNLGLKRLQASRRESRSLVELSRDVEETVADPGLHPEDALEQGEAYRRLFAVVKALPEDDQRCLILRTEGLRYREIAEVLDMSLGAVAKSLERSLARITRATQR